MISSIVLTALIGSAMAVGVDSVDLPTNSTMSCNWPSAIDLVGDIQTHKLNATDIVSQCGKTCGLIFESSNPDLAGKGVLISYYIQTALSCLFGPLFPILLYIMNIYAKEAAIRNLPLLRKLQLSVYKISAFFSICLVVGVIVIHRQSPSILEVVFIYQVSSLQMMQITTMIWAQWADHSINRSEGTKLGWDWDIYYFAILITQLATSYAVSRPGRMQMVYSQLAKECQKQHNLASVSGYIMSSSSGSSGLKWLAVGVAIGAGFSVLGCVLAVPLVKFYAWFTTVAPRWVKKHGLATLLTVILLFYAFIVILNAIIMKDFRRTWIELSGDGSRGNEWGFGQTTAILLWLPFAWETFKETIKHLKAPNPNTQNGSENQALDPEAAIPQMADGVPPPYNADVSPPKHEQQCSRLGVAHTSRRWKQLEEV